MKRILGAAIICMTAAVSFTPALAADEEEQAVDFLTELVDAAVPTGESMDDVVFSGSLGVSRYLLCSVGKSVGGNPPDDGACPKSTQ